MGTRSFVGVMENNKIEAIYVHYDGYLQGVGKKLQEYTTLEQVKELISFGDRTSLEGPYYKDRGEDDVMPVVFNSFEDFYNQVEDSWGEYYYVFKDGNWLCGSTHNGSELRGKLVPFEQALLAEVESV